MTIEVWGGGYRYSRSSNYYIATSFSYLCSTVAPWWERDQGIRSCKHYSRKNLNKIMSHFKKVIDQSILTTPRNLCFSEKTVPVVFKYQFARTQLTRHARDTGRQTWRHQLTKWLVIHNNHDQSILVGCCVIKTNEPIRPESKSTFLQVFVVCNKPRLFRPVQDPPPGVLLLSSSVVQ
jgi:hypothetical protein